MVHLGGANLKLDWCAVWADQRGVQRLIAVQFGDGDVVFELTRHGLE